MKKYLVIGNPIEHSLSPQLHNYLIKENNIEAVYEKKQLNETGIEKIIKEIKKGEVDGVNVTIPFKKYNWPTIDVTRKSVEEPAASIIKIYNIKKSK